MDREQWNAVWAGEHDPNHADHHGHQAHDHGHSGPDELLVDAVEGIAAGRSLDLGCGRGDNAVWLAERGWQAVGVDFAGAGLAKGRELASERGVEVELLLEDLTAYQPIGPFDLVTLFYVHLPAPQRQALLARAARALAPGGRLLFVGHDQSDASFFDHIDPELLTTPDEIASELEELQIERVEVVQHEVHGHTVAGTTVVLARRQG